MKFIIYMLMLVVAVTAVCAADSGRSILDVAQVHDNGFVLFDGAVDAGYSVTNDYSKARLRVISLELQEQDMHVQEWQEFKRIVYFLGED